MMRPAGYWSALVDAVTAMLPNDLLIWDVPQKDFRPAYKKIYRLRNEEFRLSIEWCDGKLFVVRMR